LLVAAQVVDEVHVCNSSKESADRAVAAIGFGTAHAAISGMPPSKLWLLSCGDDALEGVAERVAGEGALLPNAVVFQCSGLVPSDVLRAVKSKGAHIASAHPVRSFANLEMAVRDFPGTFCGIEGEAHACEVVSELFSKIQGRVFPLSAESKVLCHAGHVCASNYLVALLHSAQRLYAAAGLPEDLLWSLMEPLVRGTIDNVMRLGPTRALTGPIARGEEGVVALQGRAVSEQSAVLGDIYATLGLVAVDIARAQGLSSEKCEMVRRALRHEG
jgi:predicted short-subunit dehydrogenase-like oxidoreductase (DUF2520 family)